jgi:asparagine synthase (glutamine-hydrolysing)
MGVAWSSEVHTDKEEILRQYTVSDSPGFGHEARALADSEGKLILERDPWGVVPLYIAYLKEGQIAFASEVKALTYHSQKIQEILPGTRWRDGQTYPILSSSAQIPTPSDSTSGAALLHQSLTRAVTGRIHTDKIGSWLSGGLDSSYVATLASQSVRKLYTFAAGLKGSSDLTFAKIMADHIKSEHHSLEFTFQDLIEVLPDVIFHLESFDALLVRSSLTHYLAARAASDYVDQVFSGEGADELFAGYDYLASIPLPSLQAELDRLVASLHNTALQRVDRCAGAFGLTAHIPFLDPGVVQLAQQIPVEWKRRAGVGKWILREAAKTVLPEAILRRPKAKFWEGAGVGQLLAEHADQQISDGDFKRERLLPNGWVLNSKEELFYYRIFKERLGLFENLDWMGRTP